uniref:Uncharacterized protein n=1 Tax=Lepeophtheirus salmonis TaxID=72036 RepID=A0A0K2UD10_LEPSM
MYLSLFRLPDF